jgi:hypothetical protein
MYLFFQACIGEPLEVLASAIPRIPTIGETRILMGHAVQRVLNDSYWESLQTGTQFLVFYESWGKGESWIKEILGRFGGSLGGWTVPPHNSGKTQVPVTGYGRLRRGCRDPTRLDLRLTRYMIDLPSAEGAVVIDGCADQLPKLVSCSMQVNKGNLALAPIAIAARADPYSVDPVVGCHRRLLGRLLRC